MKFSTGPCQDPASFYKVAYCILYYIVLYFVRGVKPLFNGKHLIKRKIYVAVYT